MWNRRVVSERSPFRPNFRSPDAASGGGYAQLAIDFCGRFGDAYHDTVEAVVDQGVTLPGVSGDAATAARFAGSWTERAKVGATPDSGQRIYEVDAVVDARPTTGRLR